MVENENSSNSQNILNTSGLIAQQNQNQSLPSSLDAFLKAESPILMCKNCQTDCTSSYYHHPSAKINLCTTCYIEGKYSSDQSSTEFVKIDPTSFTNQSSTQLLGSDWTEEEILKLLEAIEKYSVSGVNLAANNVWDAIAESVGKSREACLFQFLKIPTSEFLSSTSSASSAVNPTSFLEFPFSQSDNPVLSVLSFLANSVHPRVAAVASQAALTEIAQLKSEGDATVLSDKNSMQLIASVTVACAAAHAQDLATAESKRINYWRDALIETQLKKLQLKIDCLEELERTVEEDRKEIEKQRLQLFMERFSLKKLLLQAEQKMAAASSSSMSQ